MRIDARAKRRSTLAPLLACALFCSVASAAIEPAEQPDGEAGVLTEVVVLARKRAENMQHVPVATTALDERSLQASIVTNSAQLAQLTPNMSVNGGFESVPKITLRGIGANDFNPNLSPAVGTYIDEVYMGIATSQLLQLYDVERIEILRGPQGTLYGKNATGGAVNVITHAPEPGVTNAALRLSAGNYELRAAEGFANASLGSDTAVRLSFLTRDRDGFFHNTYTGGRNRFQDIWHARAQLRSELTPRFALHARVYAGETQVDTLHRIPVGLLDPAASDATLVGGADITGFMAPQTPHAGPHNDASFDSADEYGGSLRGSADLAWAELVAISAHHHTERAAQDPADGSAYSLIRNVYAHESQFSSQELRLQGVLRRLDWIVGAHYYDESHDVVDDFNFFECTLSGFANCPIAQPAPPGYPPSGPAFASPPFPPVLAGLPIATNVILDYAQKGESTAVFGELQVDVTDALAVIAGLRYTRETRSIRSSSTARLLASPTTPSPFFPGYEAFEGERTWDDASGRVILQYDVANDVMVYGGYSTGFRSGNWNGQAFVSLAQIREPVAPETIKSYEAGLKSQWLNARLRTNLAVFYSTYEDMQVPMFLNATNVVRNATEGEIGGVELELAAAPLPGLQARLTLGYLDAEYGAFGDCARAPIDADRIPFIAPPPDCAQARAVAGNVLSGHTLMNAPEWSGTLSTDYEWRITPAWLFSVGGDVRYQSKVFFTPYSLEHLSEDAYALTNLRVGVRNPERGIDVLLWTTNVFDEQYAVDGNQIRAPFGLDFISYGPPRMYGVTVGIRF